jgi:hypothetical protein
MTNVLSMSASILGFRWCSEHLAEIQQIASFVNGPAMFVSLGEFRRYGFIADVANWNVRHMHVHGWPPEGASDYTRDRRPNGVRRRRVPATSNLKG